MSGDCGRSVGRGERGGWPGWWAKHVRLVNRADSTAPTPRGSDRPNSCAMTLRQEAAHSSLAVTHALSDAPAFYARAFSIVRAAMALRCMDTGVAPAFAP